MDATYGTNNAGMDLFAILVEVDGTGVPVTYAFLETLPGPDGKRHADNGSTAAILAEVLDIVRTRGILPVFFGCDKDSSELLAIGQVFPNAKIQLCAWHVKHALLKKLESKNETATQSNYYPAEAQQVIPELEICWGSNPTRRPSGPHRAAVCNCPSRRVIFREKARLETSTEEYRDAVLSIFIRHFNRHSSIPDQDGIFATAEQIYRDCAREMYRFCYARGWFRVWAYLWINWYTRSQWFRWARSANDN